MGVLQHFTALMCNLYWGQEATVKMESGETEWFPKSKGVTKRCILFPCVFNLYTEDILWKMGLYSEEGGVKTGERNISNVRYADDIILLEENSNDLKGLLVKEKCAKTEINLNIKTNMTTKEIHNFNKDNKDTEVVKYCAFLGSAIYSNGD